MTVFFRHVFWMVLAAPMALRREASATTEAFTISRSHVWKKALPKPEKASAFGGARRKTPLYHTRRQQGLMRFQSSGSETTTAAITNKTTTRFWTKQLFREMLAEFLGIGIIIGIGMAGDMSAMFTGSLTGLLHIAAVWSIAVTLAIAATGPVSGAHLNPVFSVAFAWLRPSKNFGWSKVIPYILAQMAGAMTFSWASLVLYASKMREFEAANSIVRGTPQGIATAKAFGCYFADSVSMPAAFFAEVFGTAMLAFIVFCVTNPKNDTIKNNVFIPPLVGITVFALISVIAPLTGAGFNGARDLGPRIVAYLAGWTKDVSFQGWWLYTVAPLIGGCMGAWLADKGLYGGSNNAENSS